MYNKIYKYQFVYVKRNEKNRNCNTLLLPADGNIYSSISCMGEFDCMALAECIDEILNVINLVENIQLIIQL